MQLGFELQLFHFFFSSLSSFPLRVCLPLCLSLVDLPNDRFNKAGHINLVMNTCFLITEDIRSRTQVFTVGWYRHGKRNPYVAK